MTVFDYIVLGVLAVSIVLGFVRGAVHEVFSLGSWIGAFLVARAFAGTVALHVSAGIESPTLRMLTSFVALFLISLALFMLLSWALSQLVKSLGLGPLDRSLGLVIGTLRGALVVMLLALIAGLTPLPAEKFWRNAMFSPPLEAAAKEVLPYMPAAFRARVKY